jgi:hypothetical protein
VRGGVELRPKLVSRNGTEAVIHDCYIDNAEFVDATTGEVQVPAAGPQPGVFKLRLQEGRWRTYEATPREDLRGAMCG